MALTALCWVMASCTDDAFNQEYGEGMGYLRLELGKVDVEVSSTTKAETVSLPEDLIPATTDDFMIDIKQGNKSVDGYPKKYSELKEGVELKAGGYTVIAYYGDNEPIQATPYFSGSSIVEIYPGKSTETNINAALANAMVTPEVSENLQKHYSAWSLKLKAGDTSMTLADKDTPNTEGYLFVKAGQSVNAVFEGTNILEKKSLHEWTVISEAVEQTKYVIQCDPDIPVFSFGLNAEAVHTTDVSGYLNGTKVSLSFGDLSNVPVSLISNWKATLVNATGEVVRSYTTTDFSKTGEMVVENDWPYLPQGDYTLKYSYTIDGNDVSEEATINDAKTITMPLPTFTAEVSAQTSYSVYTTQGATAANGTDGSSIFNIATTSTISSDILSNGKYTNLYSVTYSLNTGDSSTEVSPVFQNLQWGKHTLTAFAMFDGTSVNPSIECDVTGIPYYINFDGNSNPENWILNNNGKTQDRLTLQRGDAYALSPKYYIPSNVRVSVNLSAYAYGGSLPGGYEPTVSIHPSEIGVNSTIIATLSATNLYPDNAEFTNISTNFTLTDIVGRVCIYTKGEGNKWSTGLQYSMGVVCGYFSVNYN